MAKLSEEDLVQLEENAALMFSVKEIAIIIGCQLAELTYLVTEESSPEYTYFNRGRLKAEASVRKSIYDLAQNGSSPAQSQFLELIENAKLDDAL
ncbi:MAG: hypothetical protein M0Q51_06520 [Bacteroidales bacterium]|nr:hypothetical protein [Bacteroidales bacterium]